jgi:TPR repeat protein
LSDHDLQTPLPELSDAVLGAMSPKQRLEKLRPIAESGNANAQYQLGFRYYLGDSGAQDYTAAATWYQKAADQGHVEAAYKLSKLFASGTGIDQNFESAARYVGLAAETGHAEAQFHLGGLYAQGKGLEADPIAAHKWYSLAVEQVDADLSAYLAAQGLPPHLRGAELAAGLGDAELAYELELGLDNAKSALTKLAATMTPEAIAEAEAQAAAWKQAHASRA